MKRFTTTMFALALPVCAVACGSGNNEGNSDTGAGSTGGGSASAGESGGSGSAGTGTPAGCVNGDDPNAPRMQLAAEIDSDTTLTCDTVWVLTQATYVRGATLTVEPGTTVLGANGSALVIDVDAKIIASGTPDAPIVMTSAQPKGQRQRADWGGLVLLGKAVTNLPNGVGQAEGFADPPTYGGTDETHNCGTMQYLRIEWAGFELVMDNELNAFSFYTCGTDTTMDHVQAHMGSDDSMEFFGGGFNGKYLIHTGMADDSLDCDLGFHGAFQYVLVHQDPAEPDGNHGLEWSNGPDDFTAKPLTSPWVANMTFIGQGPNGNPQKSIGFIIKQGAEAHVYNSYFTDVSGPGSTFQDEQTLTVAGNKGIVVEGTMWGTHGAFGHEGDGPYTWTDQMWQDYIMGQNGNQDGIDLGMNLTWTTPMVKPASDSVAVGAGVEFSHPFLEKTTYVGAVDPAASDDWTQASWINYAVD